MTLPKKKKPFNFILPIPCEGRGMNDLPTVNNSFYIALFYLYFIVLTFYLYCKHAALADVTNFAQILWTPSSYEYIRYQSKDRQRISVSRSLHASYLLLA